MSLFEFFVVAMWSLLVGAVIGYVLGYGRGFAEATRRRLRPP